ncbi:MAG: patatin-like phospholipase family protein [Magnetococcales bacterium]|nr:patatin-like phospholipase family protein [Magnetococcales bacterium]MBF0346221.1 patatin-like phospholipase family protein [Magnetococcales bacterium]
MSVEGIGLALSGGGFRAGLFHLGALWRLNELGWLQRIDDITSVSGGSITSAHLGLQWSKLHFDSQGVATNFQQVVVTPLREFYSHTIDTTTILTGMLNPFISAGEKLDHAYAKRLFGKATLQNLPDPQHGVPRFTFYATNLQTGASVRMSRAYLGDYRIGRIEQPTIRLSSVVAASSAFPPFYCPFEIEVDPGAWKKWDEGGDFFKPLANQKKLYLGDGGIYDNMGMERLWNRRQTILISDAGAPMKVFEREGEVADNYAGTMSRVLDIMTEQTRALRKRMFVSALKSNEKQGTYWGIATRIADYALTENHHAPPLLSDNAKTARLAQVRTRLDEFEPEEQEDLINWGYALTDAAMRRYVIAPVVPAGSLPCPNHLV